MNNNAEDAKNKLKKPISNAGFFSMTLPAAFQRVFKKQSPTKENSEENHHYNDDPSDNVHNESNASIIISSTAITSTTNDDHLTTHHHDEKMMITSTTNNTIDNHDDNANNDDDDDDDGDDNDANNQSTEIILEESIKLNDNSIISCELLSNSTNSNDTPQKSLSTIINPKQSSHMETNTKLNSLTSDDDDKIIPLKGILITTNDISLDSSRQSSYRSRKSVSFNVTVMSEQYAPPSLFYEERTTQVIMKSYLKSCEKYKIKPLDKVLTMINEFELKSNREVKIDLKGCRLDYKQCECLEEVFRYVRTQWLDISNTFLEDDGCTSICEMCEYYDTATHICLSGNTRISNRGWLSVSQLIQKSTCLEYLDLSRTIFTEQMLHILVRAFRTVSTIKILHLEGCYLNGARLQIILSAISSNKNIRELYLAENKISSNDANCLFDLLVSNDNVKVLDLRNNSLQDNGLLKLSQGLLQQTKAGVEVLHLWNNYITANGIQGFVHVLSLHPSLHTLNLGRNKIGDEGILMIKFNLIKNKHLQRLGLSNNRITNTGAVALAELIADSTRLMRLDLRENNIGLAGIIALSQAMQVNYSVFKLDFNRNIKVEPEMTELVTRLVDDIRICCLRNRQLAKGGPLEEIISLTSVLSDDHSITESLKTIPPNELPSPQKGVDGTMSSFWQILSKFTKAKNTTNIASIIAKTDASSSSINNDATDNNHANGINLLSNENMESSDNPQCIVMVEHGIEQETTLNPIKNGISMNIDLKMSSFESHQNNTNNCDTMLVLSGGDYDDDDDDDLITATHSKVDTNDCTAESLPTTQNLTTRFGGGVGRFSISRVVEKYHYKSNYPIGTASNCEDTSSTDKSYEIHQHDISIDNDDQSIGGIDNNDDNNNIYLHTQSNLVDSPTEHSNSVDTSIKQSSDE